MNAFDQALEEVRLAFDTSCTQAARAARHQLTNELNQLMRRLRHYESEADWISALLEGAARFAEQTAVFSLQNDVVQLCAQSNLQLPAEVSFPLHTAAAFATVLETHDPVIALRTPSEVSQALASSGPSDRCHVLPIMNGQRTVAILFAGGQQYIDLNALELVTNVASAVLERQANALLHSQITPVAAAHQAGVPIQENVQRPAEHTQPANSKAALPAWADLGEEPRALHIRAQRFSRVAVAEMQLAKPQGCRTGREQGNLYLFLKPEIDKARETYRKQFMTIPSMVDYLHLELVKTAAEGDEIKLGAEYPGQLV